MSWFTDIFKKPKPEVSKKFPTWCVPSAFVTAFAWMIHERVEVRIAVQRIAEGTNHVQAQALIGGVWTYLTEMPEPKSLVFKAWKQHFPEHGEPYKYMTLKEFFDEQWEIFKIETMSHNGWLPQVKGD